MKRTKKFNQEWSEAIALLPADLQQSLNDAIRCYQNEGIEPKSLHPVAQALFIVIKPTIDARARRSAYQKERRQRMNRSCLRPTETIKPQENIAPKETPTPKPQPSVQAKEPRIQTAPDKSPSSGNRFLREVNRAKNRSRHKRYAGTH